jgi:hypothetical protein
MRVVGLGNAGCNIAKAFSKFPQYETYGIDTSKEADITIRTRDTHEAYDKNFPNLKRKLKFPSGEEVIVVLAGSGTIAGGILRLLEQLQSQRVTLIYIQPDLDLATTTQRIQERIVRNVLQEYARSGALEAIWLIDNLSLERSIGEVSIMAYYETLNQGIVNTIHMINIFKNTPAIIGTFVRPSPLSRIATIGIVDMDEEENEEKWFYDLTGAQEVVYYYGINKEDLKNDGTLFRKINNFVKSKIEDGIDVSYGVFETTYEQKYCYCIKYSPMVQSYRELLDDQDIS